MTATADQLAPIIGHRAIITYTEWDLDGAEDYMVPTTQHAVTGKLEWAEPDPKAVGSASVVVVWVEDPPGDSDDTSRLRLLPGDIVAAMDLDMGGVAYDFGQPTDPSTEPEPQHLTDAPGLWELRRRIEALAVELEEVAQDDDRDSAMVLDELPARLRKLLGGS